ncbi:hypothetical protein NE865_13959 [Phthorimaea operculella]|nr:hypothetical protein NE865_13959 [Phthorimaea operculella]
MLRYFCLLAVVLVGAKSASAPWIKPCQLSDNACVLASANAIVPFMAPGIPEWNMKSLDPMKMDIVKSEQSGLKLTFRNTVVDGMKGCKVDGIKVNKGKQQLLIRCDVTLSGNYTLTGQLLIFPVEGEGPYTLSIRDIVIKVVANIETVDGPDGKPHWSITSWKHNYNIKTSTVFHFSNLFNGNKVLADPVSKFMNDNWREVMDEVAGPIVYAIVSNTVDSVKAFYAAVPSSELHIA